MTVFEQLLQVQEHDTHLDQLHHRRDTLPERAALDEQRKRIDAHDRETALVQEQRDALARDQKRLEDEVALVTAKAADVDSTLYSGTVRSPRELQAFQEDLSALRRRQRQLEDDVIGFMEQLEPLDDELTSRAEARRELDAAADDLAAALADAEQSVDAEISEAARRRAEALVPVADDVRDQYEKLRKQHDGVAVAPLVGNVCGGCHLALSAVEIDRLKHEPPDALIFCEECGRLLVR
jgi:predicted  nucleic acid-binding Zn-ribbon protein